MSIIVKVNRRDDAQWELSEVIGIKKNRILCEKLYDPTFSYFSSLSEIRPIAIVTATTIVAAIPVMSVVRANGVTVARKGMTN